MLIREMRKELGVTQSEFAARYSIPFRTVQNWETGLRKPPDYIVRLLEQQIREDLINRKAITLPKFDAKKELLPRRSDYVGAMSWLTALRDRMGKDVVFALDEALMCQGLFGGRSDEYIVWVYGDDSLSRFNGVIVIGNSVSPYCIREKHGLRFTEFNRTLTDAIANEAILDMQGITEALSRYYYLNNESFDGIFVAPKYLERFEVLADEAVEYYDA